MRRESRSQERRRLSSKEVLFEDEFDFKVLQLNEELRKVLGEVVEAVPSCQVEWDEPRVGRHLESDGVECAGSGARGRHPVRVRAAQP